MRLSRKHSGPTSRASAWWPRLTIVLGAQLALLSTVAAQTPATSPAALETLLTPGQTAWITERDAPERRTRIVSATAGVVTVTTAGTPRAIPAADVQRVRVRRSDSGT